MHTILCDTLRCQPVWGLIFIAMIIFKKHCDQTTVELTVTPQENGGVCLEVEYQNKPYITARLDQTEAKEIVDIIEANFEKYGYL